MDKERVLKHLIDAVVELTKLLTVPGEKSYALHKTLDFLKKQIARVLNT